MEFSSVRPWYESARAARLDSAADCLLPDDSWYQQRQASGVSSTQHMIFSDECSISLHYSCVWGESVDRVPPRFASLMASWVPISFAMF